MKTALLLCVMAGNVFAAQPILVRVTADTLAKLQQRDPTIRLVKPLEDQGKVTQPENPSIIGQSTVLHDGSHWTLVPKGSVVFMPEKLKSRANAKPVGTLLSWTAFLAKNRNWITTCEMTFDQAAGNEALPAEHTAFWAKQDKIVIAVNQSGPISIRLTD